MPPHSRFVVAVAALLSLGVLSLRSSPAMADETSAATARHTGPWDVAALSVPPEATWGAKQGLVQEVFYQGEPLAGRPTRVFGWYARPAEGDGPFPAMVLVHGGGGTAFAEWATLWAERGYVALAMDLAGHGPDGQRLPDGGPEQGDEEKFRSFSDGDAADMWTYHAVAAVVRGHSLLAAQSEVDAARIGITGISWGGYLTCIVTGIDERLKVAVPVYGCGYLRDNSAWLPRFAEMDDEQRQRWVSYFDPSQYLPGASCPMLFVNGTNDFAYPLDSYKKSYALPAGRVDLCVTVNMPHGHPQGWAPAEIGLYVDSVLRGGRPLATVGRLTIEDGNAVASVSADVPLASAALHYTTDVGAWQERQWQTVEAHLEAGRVWAELPAERPLVCFVTVTDERGAVVSSDHLELPE